MKTTPGFTTALLVGTLLATTITVLNKESGMKKGALRKFGDTEYKPITGKLSPVIGGTTRYYLIADDHSIIEVPMGEWHDFKMGTVKAGKTNQWTQ